MTVDLARWHRFWKHQGSRELRDILMLWWDPIGVYGIPEALDEYDSYLGRIGSCLRAGAGAEEIAVLLGSIDFGLPSQPERDHTAAMKIGEWYEQSMRRLGELEA